MCRKFLVAGFLTASISVIDVGSATAQDAVKIGVVIPMTGAFAAVGREVAAGAKLYMQQHGDTVAGQKIELIIRDDTGVPDNGKRLAQELIVKDKVSFLGAGLTPSAMAMAPIATDGKVATVVMISGTSVVTERSPYFVRTSFTMGQQSGIIADWAIQNGSRKAVCILSAGRRAPRLARFSNSISSKAGAKSSIP
jgi:branched-chain amino acid transport system substrate-binding protein